VGESQIGRGGGLEGVLENFHYFHMAFGKNILERSQILSLFPLSLLWLRSKLLV